MDALDIVGLARDCASYSLPLILVTPIHTIIDWHSAEALERSSVTADIAAALGRAVGFIRQRGLLFDRAGDLERQRALIHRKLGASHR